MLQSIRDNSQGIIAKVIVGLIAVTFALFGVESLVSLTAGSNAPATVNGTEISEQELYRGVQLQRRQMLSQMGENADPTLLDDKLIEEMVLNGLIDQTILVQSAEQQGLEFSDRMIDQMIVSTEAFQLDGKFDRNQFEAVLRNAGLTPLMYRKLLRREKLTEQEQMAYLVSAFTLPSEVKQVLALDRQTRDLRFFMLDAEPVRAAVTLTDDELNRYFAQHTAEFMTEEQVEIEYLLLDQNQLAADISVSDVELQTAYQALKDTYIAQELRHAAHILIEISDDRDAAAAQAKAEALAGRIQAGESFADLAKAESDDPASADQGGDLGINEKGVFSAEFDDALYALKTGEVSAPVQTEFGYHLIKLLGVESSDVPSFAEAKAGLRADLMKQKAEERYVEQLEQLADISFSAGDLREPSEALGLTIIKAGPFGRSGAEDEVTSNPKVLAQAFDPELIQEGLNSTPIELDSGRSVVLRITAHHEPREQAFDEVRDQLAAMLTEEKAREALNEQADQLLAQLSDGQPLEQVAGGAEITRIEKATRNQQELPAELRTETFALPRPAEGSSTFAKVELLDGSIALVALDAVNSEAGDLSDDELRVMGQMLSSRKGQENYQALSRYLKQQAEIER